MTQRHEAARLLQATESCMVGNGEEREEGQLGRCCVMLILGAVNVHLKARGSSIGERRPLRGVGGQEEQH